MVDSAWNLIPGIICWVLWKERNSIIFREKQRPEENLLTLIKQTIRETVSTSYIPISNNTTSQDDQIILTLLNLNYSHQSNISNVIDKHDCLCQWSSLDNEILKFNYDGVTKGNRRAAGFSGVLKNSQGKIISTYDDNLGTSANNFAELHALEHVLEISKVKIFWPLVVEGDSMLTTQDCHKLQ